MTSCCKHCMYIQICPILSICTCLYSTIQCVKSIQQPKFVQYCTAQYNVSSPYSTVELPMALYIFHTNQYYLWKLYHIHSTRRTQTNQARTNQSKMITALSPSWTETLMFVLQSHSLGLHLMDLVNFSLSLILSNHFRLQNCEEFLYENSLISCHLNHFTNTCLPHGVTWASQMAKEREQRVL